MNASSLHHDEPVQGQGHDPQNDRHDDQQQSETAASEPSDHHHGDDDLSQEDDGQEDDDDHHHPDDEAYQQALDAVVAAAPWNELTPRLIGYSSYRLLRFSSAKRSGLGADDFAQQAIALALSGRRRLNLTGEPTLFSQLCSVCDSLISHEAEKTQRRIKGGMAEVPIVAQEADDTATDHVTEEHLGAPASFETELIARDRLERFTRSIEPRLAKYVRLRVSGRYATAEEYAKALSTSVQDIRNMDRRLWRKRGLYDSFDSRQTYQLPMGA